MSKRVLVGLVLLVVVSFALGAYWEGRGGGHEWRDAELDRLRVEREAAKTQLQLEMGRAYALLKFTLAAGATLILLATMGGLGWGAIRLLDHRASTLYPDENGLYPVRRFRVGGRVVFHDPNRAVSPIVIYTADGVESVMTADADTQRTITTQAQAVQALAAGAGGGRDRLPLFGLPQQVKVNTLPPLLSPDGGGMVDPKLIEAVVTDWQDTEEGER